MNRFARAALILAGTAAGLWGCAAHRPATQWSEAHDRLALAVGLPPLRAVNAQPGMEEIRLALVRQSDSPSYLLRVRSSGSQSEGSLYRFTGQGAAMRGASVLLTDAQSVKVSLDSADVWARAGPGLPDETCNPASADCSRTANAEQVTVEVRREAGYRRHIYIAPVERSSDTAYKAAALARRLEEMAKLHWRD